MANLTVRFDEPAYLPTSIWLDSRLLPVYGSAASLLILLITGLVYLVPAGRKLFRSRLDRVEEPLRHIPLPARIKAHVKSRGGTIIYLLALLRAVGCVVLVILSGVAVGLKGQPKVEEGLFEMADDGWAELALGVAYLYVSTLSLLTIAPGPITRRVCGVHAKLVLLILFGVFAARNIWPLSMTNGVPADLSVEWLLWSTGVVLATVSILLPLLTPRQYYPVDPGDPMEKPSPEQTSSPLLFAFWVFMDPVVFRAYRLAKLPYDQLPPLPDYDWSKHLAARSFDKLDPLRRRGLGLKDRYLFWGLMEVFRWDYVQMAVLLTTRVFAIFLGPLGINRVLTYLETGGEGAVYRPWLWILCLLLDPVIGSISFHLYFFITTHIIVQTESIMVQLIFQHSLKIRLKDDPPTTRSTGSTAVATPAHETLDSVEVDSRSTVDSNETAVGTESSASPSATAQANKGKHKATRLPQFSSSPEKTDKAESSHIVGKINNLIGTDLGNLIEGRDFLFVLLQAPLQTAICVAFLWAILGWSALVGMAVMLACLPLPAKVAQWVQAIQTERMVKTDARVESITEALNVIRMIKMFGWESQTKEQITEKRNEELEYVKKRQIMNMINMILNFVIPLITMMVTFAFYSLAMGQELTASKVFSSMTVFDSLRNQLHVCFYEIPMIIAARVSLDRIDEFLNKTELLDRHTPANTAALQIGPTDPFVIGFHNATFMWSDTNRGTPTPGPRNFRLHIDSLTFKPDCINLIVGPTGSGKTSILMALLGEMHFQPSGPDSWFLLPRSEGVAYAAQESWLQNDTIKENILFGEPYEEQRYKKVIHQCALESDLTLFDAEDETEVGEKGLTLSGGQKSRVTLARAIYSKARILLLDDVLSALDVHTARWIVDKCLRGDLVSGRTILLITHNVALAAPVAANIVSLGLDGQVSSKGTVAQALLVDPLLRDVITEDADALKRAEGREVLEGKPEPKKSDGKLIVAEEMAEGRLSWRALWLLVHAFGGAAFWIFVTLGLFVTGFGLVMSTWWLGYWATAYEQPHSGGVEILFYLGVYGGIVVSCILIYCVDYYIWTLGSIAASRRIHNQLRDKVLGSTLRWLDSTPVGRIISRFTQDMRQIDGPLAGMLNDLMELSGDLASKFAAVVYFSPIFTIPAVLVALLGGWLGQVYIGAQVSVKREMSNCRSPLYSHFAAAIAGLVSIRAYGAELSLQKEILKRIDHYSRTARTFCNLNRWISVRIDVLGALFTSGLAAYLVYVQTNVGPSDIGFSLNMAVSFTGMILWWVRFLNEFEIAGNSLERVLDYLVIEQEPTPTEKGKPPAYWPSSGSLRAKNLCARYTEDGPHVLEDINFEIKSGERIGIVGRTGSGKSSLTLSLLRMIPSTGVVYFDGLPTHEMNLDALRKALTIIPQDPTLLSGTLRANLDPFSEHDDAVLNDALRASGLFRIQTEDASDSITLDSQVSTGGRNFSLGQRQIIALARAIVRGAKVLILDEATASVDAETDNAIQASIRTELKDATLITVAHRLQTIADYDRIMVLDAGKIIEFDTPSTLLEKEEGMFRALVENSGDKEKLWQMARGGRASSSTQSTSLGQEEMSMA